MQLKIGTCGWGLKGGHEAYFSEFGVVELQDTFNKLPKPETARHWKEEAPSGFEFTMKAWQAITHPSTSPTWRQGKLPEGNPEHIGLLQPTEENLKAWSETAEICKILGCKILVVQTPPKFDSTREHIQNVRSFFSKVKRPCAVAWEPRGRWDNETIRGMCNDLNLIHVVDPFRNKPSGSTASAPATPTSGTGIRIRICRRLPACWRAIVMPGKSMSCSTTCPWARMLSHLRK